MGDHFNQPSRGAYPEPSIFTASSIEAMKNFGHSLNGVFTPEIGEDKTKSSPMTEAFVDQTWCLDVILDKIALLENLLRPVLGPAYTTDSSVEPQEDREYSPVVHTLQNNNSRLRFISNRLEEFIERLEI